MPKNDPQVFATPAAERELSKGVGAAIAVSVAAFLVLTGFYLWNRDAFMCHGHNGAAIMLFVGIVATVLTNGWGLARQQSREDGRPLRVHLWNRYFWGFVLMVASIIGNFAAATVARFIGFRKTIVLGCIGYFLAVAGAYCIQRDHASLIYWLAAPGFFSGLFALFTMYLPPLFPTLLRTTGAGFSYNIGRILAAAGTIFFGFVSQVGDYRLSLFYAGFLFLPAAMVALFLPDMGSQERSPAPSS